MKKQPKNAQELRRIGAAEAFIDARMALGRVSFSLDDLTKESELSAIAAKYQLLRLRGKVIRVSRRQQFFLIVAAGTSQHGRSTGDLVAPRLH